MNSYYFLPFTAEDLLNGRTKRINHLGTSIEQNLELMLSSNVSTECHALPGYGTTLKTFLFQMPQNESENNWKKRVLKEIEQSLKNSIRLYEKRLADPIIKLELVNFTNVSKLKDNSAVELSKFPRGYVLRIHINGFYKMNKRTERFSFKKEIALG